MSKIPDERIAGAIEWSEKRDAFFEAYKDGFDSTVDRYLDITDMLRELQRRRAEEASTVEEAQGVDASAVAGLFTRLCNWEEKPASSGILKPEVSKEQLRSATLLLIDYVRLKREADDAAKRTESDRRELDDLRAFMEGVAGNILKRTYMK